MSYLAYMGLSRTRISTGKIPEFNAPLLGPLNSSNRVVRSLEKHLEDTSLIQFSVRMSLELVEYMTKWQDGKFTDQVFTGILDFNHAIYQHDKNKEFEHYGTLYSSGMEDRSLILWTIFTALLEKDYLTATNKLNLAAPPILSDDVRAELQLLMEHWNDFLILAISKVPALRGSRWQKENGKWQYSCPLDIYQELVWVEPSVADPFWVKTERVSHARLGVNNPQTLAPALIGLYGNEAIPIFALGKFEVKSWMKEVEAKGSSSFHKQAILDWQNR